MAKPVTVVVIGAGSRGTSYLQYALDFPDRFKCVGVADVRKFYLERMQKTHAVPEECVFDDWKKLAAMDKFADCAIIATPDRVHKEPAIALAKKGYHIFLEKPMAVTYADCSEIVEFCKGNDKILAVAHVLRYTPQARKIREIIDSGKIGDVVNIQHLEPVGFWHFAHSFVRGNWRREDESTFSLLAKSCHDLDLLTYWLGDRKCTNVSSFGSLKHFTKENKPEGSSSRCVDCAVEASCPYSAKKIYLDRIKQGHTGFPVKNITGVVDVENVMAAIENGPYGKCAYDCDNDVVDNQVVNMEFEGGTTVSFTMVAHTEKKCMRQVIVFGTKGQISCDFDDALMTVEHFDFNTRKTTLHKLKEERSADAIASRMAGHKGSDFYTMDAFVKAVQVGFWHFTHAFVRGNWRREDQSSFGLLSKSCHDIDLLTYWLGDLKCTRVSSFGSLKHFTKENKPEGSSSRCVDCAVESSCPYSAKKIYLELAKQGHTDWPLNVISEVVDVENVTNAIKNGPYGRCVYECDNDVVDNQVVNMEFEGGTTVSFSMVAYTKLCERQVSVFGTKGQLKCDFGDAFMTVEHFDFNTRKTTCHNLHNERSADAIATRVTGHGGADFYAIDAFVSAVRDNDPNKVLTGAEDSLRSHLLCFQAEKARLTNQVILNPEQGPFTGL